MVLKKKISKDSITRQGNTQNRHSLAKDIIPQNTNESSEKVSAKIVSAKPRKKKVFLFEEILLGCILKKGKKTCARNILAKALTDVCCRTGSTFPIILRDIEKKLILGVEIKTIRMRKRITLIPVPVRESRQYFLAANLLLSVVKQDRTKRPFFEKLADEIYSLITSESSNIIKQQESILRKAGENMSNAHYRW
jgi:ribosomal protein S7